MLLVCPMSYALCVMTYVLCLVSLMSLCLSVSALAVFQPTFGPSTGGLKYDQQRSELPVKIKSHYKATTRYVILLLCLHCLSP